MTAIALTRGCIGKHRQTGSVSGAPRSLHARRRPVPHLDITHTVDGGTRLTGAERGDHTVVAALAAAGVRWRHYRRHGWWTIVGTQKRAADHTMIERVAAQLRKAGHTVTITAPGPRGRRPVGDRQAYFVLAEGQAGQVAAVAGSLAMSGSDFIRRAITGLVDGSTPLPDAGEVPAPNEARRRRTVTVPTQHLNAVTCLAKALPGSSPVQRRDALIRWAVARELATEHASLDHRSLP